MKKTFTIAAIAMFAVILGMSALAPAMASKPGDDGKHKIEFCHYQEAKDAIYDLEDPTLLLVEAVPEDYLVIETDKKGKMNGHFKGPSDNQVAHHFPDADGDGVIDAGGQGDFIFTNDDEENNPTPDDNDSEADCIALHKKFNPDTEG
jgi:hypothetical protein